jgi:hypothetical protein
MKKIYLIIAALTVLSLTGCEAGSYFDPNTAQLQNDKVGRLEATGEDLRVYEFTPQTSPEKQCVFVAGDAKGGLQCWDKKGDRVVAPSS